MEIDRQVKTAIDKAHDIALHILRLNRDLLETTTQTLLEQEVLDGDALQTILAQVKAPIELSPWLSGSYDWSQE